MTMPTDDDLLRRAVHGARKHSAPKGVKHPRWVAVMETFALGSTRAHELVARYGLDPDEMVKRT
jgi:hypothetical protein